MAKPISPDDVGSIRTHSFPPGVIEAFNALIALKWNGAAARITEDEAVLAIIAKTGVTRQAVFGNRWLDVESCFRAAGWKVDYDKPGYNETYEASFTFTRAP